MSLRLNDGAAGAVDWTTELVARVVPRHRLVLVLSTVILSVSGSRVANDPKDLPSWLVAVGAAVLMYLSEAHREFEQAARELVVPGVTLNGSRRDIIKARGGRRHAAALLVSTAAIALGTLAPIVVRQ